MTDHVIARIEGALGRLTLNRPQALHALTTDMCRAMIAALQAWARDPAVRAVLIDHADGTRGFCAGGDIRMLAESGACDGVAAREFFHTEYRLNHLIHGYGKPIVALMDGVTMGGGVGISVHAPVRVATERTVFAMPETGIGLFPDVGGGWFLPRLPEPELGTWLALTGARLKGADVAAAGIATHYAPSEALSAIRDAVVAAAQDGGDVRVALAPFAAAVGPIAPMPLPPLFGHDTMEAIVAALEADGRDWPLAQLATLRTKSPQTLKVALRQLRLGARAETFAENMAMEYRIGCRVVALPDFQEGVRAVILDKDNAPRWSPARLEDVPESLLGAIFAMLPADQEWTPL